MRRSRSACQCHVRKMYRFCWLISLFAIDSEILLIAIVVTFGLLAMVVLIVFWCRRRSRRYHGEAEQLLVGRPCQAMLSNLNERTPSRTPLRPRASTPPPLISDDPISDSPDTTSENPSSQLRENYGDRYSQQLI